MSFAFWFLKTTKLVVLLHAHKEIHPFVEMFLSCEAHRVSVSFLGGFRFIA